MWNLLKFGFSFVGVTSTGPMLAIVGVVGSLAVGGLGLWMHSAIENYKQGLRNEGANQCIGAVKAAEVTQIKADLKESLQNLANERRRAAELDKTNEELRRGSADQHKAIDAALRTSTATIPDAAVDQVNAPIRKPKPSADATAKR